MRDGRTGNASYDIPVTYELINTVTTNTLASFASAQEARDALDAFRATDEKFAASLTVVAFDDEGLALDEVEAHGGARRGLSCDELFDLLSKAPTGHRYSPRWLVRRTLEHVSSTVKG